MFLLEFGINPNPMNNKGIVSHDSGGLLTDGLFG
jgi:hypothetical protein